MIFTSIDSEKKSMHTMNMVDCCIIIIINLMLSHGTSSLDGNLSL